MLFQSGFNGPSWSVHVVWVDDYTRGAVVVRLYHFTLEQWQVFLWTSLPTIALNVVEVLIFKLLHGAEKLRVIRHIEHPEVLYRPRALLIASRTIYQNRMPLVNAACDLGITSIPEHGCGTRVGIYSGEVSGK